MVVNIFKVNSASTNMNDSWCLNESGGGGEGMLCEIRSSRKPFIPRGWPSSTV